MEYSKQGYGHHGPSVMMSSLACGFDTVKKSVRRYDDSKKETLFQLLSKHQQQSETREDQEASSATTVPTTPGSSSRASSKDMQMTDPISPQDVMEFPCFFHPSPALLPSANTTSNSQASRSVPKTQKMRTSLILALVDTKTSQFELLSLNDIQSPKATIGYVLDKVIRRSAANQSLATSEYWGICDYRGKLLDRSTHLADIARGKQLPNNQQRQRPQQGKQREADDDDDIEFHDAVMDLKGADSTEDDQSRNMCLGDQILIAISNQSTSLESTLFARNIISHRKIVNSVRKHFLEYVAVTMAAVLLVWSLSLSCLVLNIKFVCTQPGDFRFFFPPK